MEITHVHIDDFNYSQGLPPVASKAEEIGSFSEDTFGCRLDFHPEEVQKVFAVVQQHPLENGMYLIGVGENKTAIAQFEGKELKHLVFTDLTKANFSGSFSQYHGGIDVIQGAPVLYRREVAEPEKSTKEESLAQTKNDLEVRRALAGTPNIQSPPLKVVPINGQLSLEMGAVGSIEHYYANGQWQNCVYSGEPDEELKEQVKEQDKNQISDFVRGMGGMHEKGFIHRDVKIDNALVDGEGRVHVSDFGGSISEKDLQKEFYEAHNNPENFNKLLGAARTRAFGRSYNETAVLENLVIQGDYKTFREMIGKWDVHAMGVSFIYLYLTPEKNSEMVYSGAPLFHSVVFANHGDYEGQGLEPPVDDKDEVEARYKEALAGPVLQTIKEGFMEIGFSEHQADLLSRTVHPDISQVPTMHEVYQAFNKSQLMKV